MQVIAIVYLHVDHRTHVAVARVFVAVSERAYNLIVVEFPSKRTLCYECAGKRDYGLHACAAIHKSDGALDERLRVCKRVASINTHNVSMVTREYSTEAHRIGRCGSC